MIRRLTGAAVGAALITTLAVSTAFAGEITGNGKTLRLDEPTKWGTLLHGRSECAWSGQEDLQFEDEQGNPLPAPTKGQPAHAQSWGQLSQEDRAFLTSVGAHPGMACNPTRATGMEE